MCLSFSYASVYPALFAALVVFWRHCNVVWMYHSVTHLRFWSHRRPTLLSITQFSICIYVCVYVNIHIDIFVYMYIYVYIYTYIYTYIYIHTHAYIYTRTYIHTNKHRLQSVYIVRECVCVCECMRVSVCVHDYRLSPIHAEDR